jgi:hypothetical protein
MRVRTKIVLRVSAWFAALIGVLTIAVTAFTYSGGASRETVRALARVFFVQVWKGSQTRATAKSATPEGRIIQ